MLRKLSVVGSVVFVANLAQGAQQNVAVPSALTRTISQSRLKIKVPSSVILPLLSITRHKRSNADQKTAEPTTNADQKTAEPTTKVVFPSLPTLKRLADAENIRKEEEKKENGTEELFPEIQNPCASVNMTVSSLESSISETEYDCPSSEIVFCDENASINITDEKNFQKDSPNTTETKS